MLTVSLITRMTNKAQMLIEIVIAVGILALVLIGVSDLMTRTQRVSNFQAKRDEAVSIAKEILNDYRLQRDNDPDGFAELVTGLNKPTCIEGKNYSCVATVEDVAGDIDITVTVSWVEGENTFSINLNQKLNDQ